MYQIMLVAKEGTDITNTDFKFLLERDEETGKYHVYEAETLEEANEKVSYLLNECDKSRFDLMLIQQIKFNVYTDILIPSV